MRLARDLRDRFVPERHRALATEVFKFGAVGGVNTAIDYAVLNALLAMGPIKAKIIAAVIATTASYFMNRHWTFQNHGRSSMRREYVLFFALNGVGLLIQGAVLAIAKYGLHFSEHNADDRIAFNVANALGIGIAMVFRFWAYRTFVFTTAPETSELEADVEALEVALTDVAAVPAPGDTTAPQAPGQRHTTDEYVDVR